MARTLNAAQWLDGPLGYALSPFGWLFGRISQMRVNAYQRGWCKSYAPPVPTLSIGNLSAGGTGKTPLLLHLLEDLQDRGIEMGVLSRGYGGDEGRLLERRSPVARLMENPDRVTAAQRLLQQENPPQVLILDDGFQHLRIRRQLDVVLIDALRPWGRCLPAGLFREPRQALRRASVVLLSRADLISSLDRQEIWKQIQALRDGLSPFPEMEGVIRCEQVRRLTGDPAPEMRMHIHDRHLMACGIGNPASFQKLLQQMEIPIATYDIRADHYPWQASDLNTWERQDWIWTTEKDAVKLQHVAPRSLKERILEVRVDWRFSKGEDSWSAILDDWLLPVRAGRIEPLWAAHQPRIDGD